MLLINAACPEPKSAYAGLPMDEVEEELAFEAEPEAPEESTAEDSDSGGSGGGSKLLAVAVAVGVIGLVLGSGGIFMAMSAKSELAEFREEVKSRPDPLPTVQAEMDALRRELTALDEKLANSNSQLGSVVNQTKRAFEDITREIKANREEINKSAKLLGETGKRIAAFENVKPVKVKPVSSGSSAELARVAEKPEDGYHIIVSGDNFDKLAKLYGSTIEAFMQSNPGVNPRGLQIGQRIKIPE